MTQLGGGAHYLEGALDGDFFSRTQSRQLTTCQWVMQPRTKVSAKFIASVGGLLALMTCGERRPRKVVRAKLHNALITQSLSCTGQRQSVLDARLRHVTQHVTYRSYVEMRIGHGEPDEFNTSIQVQLLSGEGEHVGVSAVARVCLPHSIDNRFRALSLRRYLSIIRRPCPITRLFSLEFCFRKTPKNLRNRICFNTRAPHGAHHKLPRL